MAETSRGLFVAYLRKFLLC